MSGHRPWAELRWNGGWITVPNPRWHWWAFWRPRTVHRKTIDRRGDEPVR